MSTPPWGNWAARTRSSPGEHGGEALLGAQDPRRDDRRGVGIPVRWLRALLPGEAGGRGRRRGLLHLGIVPAAGYTDVPLHRLRQPPRPGAGLRRPRPRYRGGHPLAAGHLRLPPGGGGQAPLSLAPPAIRLPGVGAPGGYLG